jgi:hypothetical protein
MFASKIVADGATAAMPASVAQSPCDLDERTKLTKRFPAASVEAQVAGDCWLYGHAFIFERVRYRVTDYYLTGDCELSVVVRLEGLPPMLEAEG